jgi:hypothetical protein
MKKVSAIVFNWHGEDVLSVCLASLLEQNMEDLLNNFPFKIRKTAGILQVVLRRS